MYAQVCTVTFKGNISPCDDAFFTPKKRVILSTAPGTHGFGSSCLGSPQLLQWRYAWQISSSKISRPLSLSLKFSCPSLSLCRLRYCLWHWYSTMECQLKFQIFHFRFNSLPGYLRRTCDGPCSWAPLHCTWNTQESLVLGFSQVHPLLWSIEGFISEQNLSLYPLLCLSAFKRNKQIFKSFSILHL